MDILVYSAKTPLVQALLDKKNRLTLLGSIFDKVSMEQKNTHTHIAARDLATYLIPGCVGRGVRLGSESLSGAACGVGGVWKL